MLIQELSNAPVIGDKRVAKAIHKSQVLAYGKSADESLSMAARSITTQARYFFDILQKQLLPRTSVFKLESCKLLPNWAPNRPSIFERNTGAATTGAEEALQR